MDVILNHAKGYFTGEAEIQLEVKSLNENDNKIFLNSLTSIVSMGGSMNMLVMFSFQDTLIKYLLEEYAEDLDINEESEDENYLEDMASEIINIIIGNAVGDFDEQWDAINLSPPIVVAEAKSISRHKTAVSLRADCGTEKGDMSMTLIAPISGMIWG
jgi:CheY-specific phosphatase CheX